MPEVKIMDMINPSAPMSLNSEALWDAILAKRAQQKMLSEVSPAQFGMMKADASIDASEGEPVVVNARPPVRERVMPKVNPAQEAATVDKDKLQALIEQYGAKSKEMLNQQQSGISQLEQGAMEMRQKPRGFDFSSLMGFSDFMNDRAKGEGLQARYKAPMSDEDRQAKIMAIDNTIQQRREGLTKQQLEMMKEQLSAYEKAQVDPLKTEKTKAEIAALHALSGQRADGKVIGDTAVSKISDFDSGLNELSTIADGLDKYADVMGPVAGRVNAANPFNQRAQEFQADIDRGRQVIGKAVEGGVLRKEDEAKYMKMLPVLKDTPEVATYKMRQFYKKLVQDRNNYVNNLGASGYKTKNIPLASVPAQQTKAKPSGGKIPIDVDLKTLDEAGVAEYIKTHGGNK